ncbi:probable cytochrome P450 4s3 [Phlebotomus argentipes]|uniref:probable cytochrome P450 4s3 n=1 Tax=Phlebotomus argentipes TaxID=94469 RepID=UPI0028933B27|nr:probable cytochrome P450 4s3 [Phlebotomus argentipes]XP_059619151.1 probable cytochrome P450 4s3 [Phlebotomus argentipes]
MIGVAIFLVLLVVYLLKIDFFQRCVRFKKIIDFSYKFPGPPILELAQKAHKEKVLPWLMDCRRKYGPRFVIWFGKDLVVFLTQPEDIKIVLSSQEIISKSGNYKVVMPWLGEGLLTSTGSKWQKNRKLLTPAFHFNILKQFQVVMDDCSDILIKKLSKVATDKPVDIYPFITLYALDVICETAMGIKKNAQENSESEYVMAVKKICELTHRRSFSMVLRIPFFFNLSSYKKAQDKTLKILHDETRRVIKLRRKALENLNINTSEVLSEASSMLGVKKRLAFLDMLLIAQREGKDLSDEHIRQEVDTFMFEGHDTTSSAIAFTIYLLSHYPKEQEIAYQEARDYEGQELETMKYLEAVIKETLRIYPSVPFYSRWVEKEVKVGDVVAPPGVTLSVQTYILHHDPEIFPEPNVFKPERFLDSENMHPYAYVPFSAGPRNCIGQKFAMLEMKKTLAKLLRHFEFLPVDAKPILLAELILKSDNGVQVRLKKRS